MRTILHVDLNNFYASVETLLNPNLKGKFVGVCGNVESRHGIILAKSENAKKLGVKTGMTINDALKLCKDLVLVEANHENYIKYSKLVRQIYRDYTDRIEPFGIDECWLDVTNSLNMFKSGENIANLIRERVKNEIGLTVSVGVSFNKVFAKLGSDYKKPDATTVISPTNYKEIVYKLPVGDLLFVGKNTFTKLKKINVNTIGDLAMLDKEFLIKKFGKWGGVLSDYANGLDDSEVLLDKESSEVKSIGNSITSYRDLTSIDDIKVVLTVLAESVSSRLIEANLGKATNLSIYMRFADLSSVTRQTLISSPTVLEDDFIKVALDLIKKNYDFSMGIRTLGISVSNFTKDIEQLSIFENDYSKKLKLNKTVSQIKSKYGNKSVLKGILLKDKKLLREDPEETHKIHPDGHI